MDILDGRIVASQIKDNAKILASRIENEYNDAVKLVVIQVGNDPASCTYIRNKEKACGYVGIETETHRFDSNVSTDILVDFIEGLNVDDSVNGILVQLPLPVHLNEQKIINAINPDKDVDGFTFINAGKLARNYKKRMQLLPCTPMGIMNILSWYDINVAGKNCVVVGRSNIVGRPMAELLLNSDATVTICNSHTSNLKDICKNADVLVCAVGKPKFFTEEYIKDGAIVIDVGMNRDDNGKLCGDVDFDSVSKLSGAITPVPGGVGQMTVAMLMDNCITAYCLQHNLLYIM